MPNTTMTLALTGDVPLNAFADAISNFRQLVEALAVEVGASDGVEWIIDALERSSTIATVRGESDNEEMVENVVNGFIVVGRALESKSVVPFSRSVVVPAHAITRVLNGAVTSVRFETAEEDITIAGVVVPPRARRIPPAYGAIEGYIQALTNRNSLRFSLYDILHDRAVSCYLAEGQEHLMREAWAKHAIVEGLITRDPATMRPTSIRQISRINLIPERRGNYLDARGIISAPHDASSPEDAIRRIRDG